MCLGLVMRVKEIQDKEAICDYLGNKRKVRIDVLKKVKINDYVLVHAGIAISKIEEKEAKARLDIFKELEEKLKEV